MKNEKVLTLNDLLDQIRTTAEILGVDASEEFSVAMLKASRAVRREFEKQDK